MKDDYDFSDAKRGPVVTKITTKKLDKLQAERDLYREALDYFFLVHDTTDRSDYECVAKEFRETLEAGRKIREGE